MIKPFKQYFSKLGIYNGDINNPLIDDQFVFAAKSIENKLSTEIKKLNPNSLNAFGTIIVGDSLNPQASPQDIEKAFDLISKAQATMDAIDIKDTQENPPIATKFVPTADDKIDSPLESQQIGATEELMPEKLANNMDERFLLFSMLR
jgi:hypothetical protein